MLYRAIREQISSALQQMPVVFINGPRQTGKSTLVESFRAELNADYITLDDVTTFAAAKSDPENFLKRYQRPVIIDEIQLVPELFRPLKAAVDRQRLANKPSSYGRYLLTGSVSIMALPNLSEALVGRMAILTLYPLSAYEVLEKQTTFLSSILKKEFSNLLVSDVPLNTILLSATFPELALNSSINRTLWMKSYLNTLLQRDIKSLAEVEKVEELPNLLKLLGARAGGILNDAGLARDAGLNVMTTRRYRGLLNALFLTISISPWYKNIGKRFIKAPKVYLIDTNLLLYLLGVDLSEVKEKNPILYGRLVENFVLSEIIKQLGSESEATLYHYRTHEGQEIDFIIEKQNGDLLAIEVKTRGHVVKNDFKVIENLQQCMTNNEVIGIVFYTGSEVVAFGQNQWAVPVSCLWG